MTNDKTWGIMTKLIQISEKLKQLKQFGDSSLTKFFKKRWKKCLTLRKSCDNIKKSLRENSKKRQNRTLIIKQWNNPENSMNFHSKNWQRCQALENSKNSIGSWNPQRKIQRNEPLLFRNKNARESSDKEKAWEIKLQTNILTWEFDPGSGWTLAACLTHASRTKHLGTNLRKSEEMT